jgi:hypothetical protein
MFSALVGSLVLLSIGILMAHAMEGLFWLGDRRPPVSKNTAPPMRRPLEPCHRPDAVGS